ncbi:MAG: metallophosphoesterase, partial [Planctomycetota bacterium]
MSNIWSFLSFLAVVLAVLGLVHWFLYRGLVRGLDISSPVALVTLRGLAVLLAVSYILTRFLDSSAPRAVVLVAHWCSSVWVGLMFHLFWVGLLFWIAKVLLWATGIWGRLGPHHALLGRVGVGSVAAIAVVLCVVGMLTAQRAARVRRVAVPVKAITPELRALKIVVVADFHAGTLVGTTQIDRWVDEIASHEPDLVLVPGDIIDYPPERVPELAASFARLTAPLGVFATTGNHEYYVGVRRAVAFLERAGMRVLMNQCVELPVGLIVGGIEDRTALSYGRKLPSVAEILGPDARSRPTIFLNHTPATEDSEEAMAAGADLMVSGHT